MLNSEDIESISSTVCRDMLGLDFAADVACNEALPLSMLAAIRISGDFRAIVEVATTPGAASAVTSAMCGIPLDEIRESDLADSLGEIVNIIGGNIKGAVPGETNLSLPCVNLNNTETCFGPTENGAGRLFRLADEPFYVRLTPTL